MKHLGFVTTIILFCFAQYGCSSGASGQTQAADPIVGHWNFMQYSNGTPDSINPTLNPNVCVGYLDIASDLTYTAWNSCRLGDDLTLQSGSWSVTTPGIKLSTGLYAFGSYVVLLSQDGNTAVYNDLLSNNAGHYEHGTMLRGVAFDTGLIHR